MKRTLYFLPIVLLFVGMVSYAAQKGETQTAQYAPKSTVQPSGKMTAQPVEKSFAQPAEQILKPDVNAEKTHVVLNAVIEDIIQEPGGRISVSAGAFFDLIKLFGEIEVIPRPGPGRTGCTQCCIYTCRSGCPKECVCCD